MAVRDEARVPRPFAGPPRKGARSLAHALLARTASSASFNGFAIALFADSLPLVAVGDFVEHLHLTAFRRAERGQLRRINRLDRRRDDRADPRRADRVNVQRAAAERPDFAVHASTFAAGKSDV